MITNSKKSWMIAILALTLAGAAKSEQYGFLSIPAKKASKNSSIEPRLGIYNDTGLNRWYKVQFYVDYYDPSYKLTSNPISIIVNAGQWGLFNCQWLPTYFPGNHTLLYEVKDWTYGDPGSAYIKRGSQPITIVNSDTGLRSPSIPTVGWIEPGVTCFNTTNTQQQLIDRINEMHALEMDTIVVAYVEDIWLQGGGAFYQSNIPELAYERHYDDPYWTGNAKFHVLDTILGAAQTNGQKVILGIGRGPGPAKVVENFTSAEVTAHFNFQSYVAAELWSKYGATYKNTIYGWYISHECGNFTAQARSYYDYSALNLDQYGPHMPVMISPYGYNQNFTWANINASKVDIFAYQDGAGAGVNLNTGAITFDPQVPISQLNSKCSTYYNRHAGTGKHLWSMSEAWRIDDWINPPFAGEMWYELSYQFWYEKPYVSQIVFNEFLGCMRSPANNSGLCYSLADVLWPNYVSYYDYYKNR